MNDTRSTAYAPASPIVAMRIPPIAGPTIEAIWKFSWLSAMADGSRSGGTRRGMAEDRVGWSTAASPAATNATANRAGTGGEPCSASRTRARLQAASPAWVAISSLRRSTASASEPAPRAKSRIGTSWNSVSAAIASVEPGQDIDLVRQRDPGDLVADPVDGLAGPQPAIVAVATEWRDIEEEPPDATAPLGAGRSRPYLSRSGPARTACAAASRATGTRNGEHDT